MKKWGLLIIAIISCNLASGQVTAPDTTKREFNNVIGVDATQLLREFFNLGSTYYVNYPYMISYRRIFKSNALRVLLGGNISKDNEDTNDTTSNNQTRSNFNFALGFEHYSYINKRLNFYFGMDAIFNYSTQNDKSNTSTTQSYEQTSSTYGYGISPLVGLQFKIWRRISVATETSYDFTFVQSKESRTQIPNSSNDTHSTDSGIRTNYNPAGTIIFRYLL